MSPPDPGLKINELSQQKGLTQEKLAEYCDVSTRACCYRMCRFSSH